MLQTMDADARLQFPPEVAPVQPELAEAVIEFGNALARGDDATVREKLDRPSQGVLDTLVSNEEWFDATEKIEAVRVVLLEGASSSAGGGVA